MTYTKIIETIIKKESTGLTNSFSMDQLESLKSSSEQASIINFINEFSDGLSRFILSDHDDNQFKSEIIKLWGSSGKHILAANNILLFANLSANEHYEIRATLKYLNEYSFDEKLNISETFMRFFLLDIYSDNEVDDVLYLLEHRLKRWKRISNDVSSDYLCMDKSMVTCKHLFNSLDKPIPRN